MIVASATVSARHVGLGGMSGVDKALQAQHCPFCPYGAVPADALEGWPRLRARVHELFDDPSSSRAAQLWSFFVMVLISVSTVAFVIETLPSLEDSPVWFVLETVIVAAFTFEYVVRFVASRDRLHWLVAPLNIIDLFAVLPYYIDLVGDSGEAESLRVFRVVRLARVFRLFKISRYSSYMQIMVEALSKSADAFGLLLFFVVIAVVIFSSLMYFAERGTEDAAGTFRRRDGSVSPFNSIPASFYWCIITMTTVGYGDMFPVSTLGKVVAGVTTLCGILVIALPVTILGSNFQDVYSLHKKSKKPANRDETPPEQIELAAEVKRMHQCRAELRASFDRVRTLIRENSADPDIRMGWSMVEYVVMNGLTSIERFLKTVELDAGKRDNKRASRLVPDVAEEENEQAAQHEHEEVEMAANAFDA